MCLSEFLKKKFSPFITGPGIVWQSFSPLLSPLLIVNWDNKLQIKMVRNTIAIGERLSWHCSINNSFYCSVTRVSHKLPGLSGISDSTIHLAAVYRLIHNNSFYFLVTRVSHKLPGLPGTSDSTIHLAAVYRLMLELLIKQHDDRQLQVYVLQQLVQTIRNSILATDVICNEVRMSAVVSLYTATASTKISCVLYIYNPICLMRIIFVIFAFIMVAVGYVP